MATNDDYLFTLDLAVRDYECDMEAIVNNAVYLNYLEHARHEFLRDVGVDFADLTRRGVHPVVVRSELDYKSPLRSGDRFRVGVRLERVSRLRVAFVQDIHRLSPAGEAGDLIVEARIIAAVASTSGRPVDPADLDPRFGKLLNGVA